jgi:drug/metabolite transporter (DMT)-like permease
MATLLPYGVALLAVTFYSLLGPLAKKIGATIPPFGFIATSSLLLFLSAGALSLLFEKEEVGAALQKADWRWLLAFSTINLVAYLLWLVALGKIPVTHYQLMSILIPVIGGIAAFYLLKEPFHMRYLAALAFMFIGLVIAVKPELFKSGKN